MKHYIDEIGTRVVVNVQNFNISDYDSILLKIKKPDGTLCNWSTALISGCYFEHISESGDFDQAGKYSVQPYVASSGWTGVGETATFNILRYFC